MTTLKDFIKAAIEAPSIPSIEATIAVIEDYKDKSERAKGQETFSIVHSVMETGTSSPKMLTRTFLNLDDEDIESIFKYLKDKYERQRIRS